MLISPEAPAGNVAATRKDRDAGARDGMTSLGVAPTGGFSAEGVGGVKDVAAPTLPSPVDDLTGSQTGRGVMGHGH